MPSELVEGVLIYTQYCFESCPGHWAADWYAGDLYQVLVSELIPPELKKRTHARRHLAQEKDASIRQRIPYPTTKPGFGFGGVHTGQRWAPPSGLNLDALENNSQGTLNSGWLYHLERLSGVCCGQSMFVDHISTS